MGSKIVHCCISVRGVLNYDKRMMKQATKWITIRGRQVTPQELRDAFMDELAQGHEVLPYGKMCEGFDFKEGCPGHRSEEEVVDVRDT